MRVIQTAATYSFPLRELLRRLVDPVSSAVRALSSGSKLYVNAYVWHMSLIMRTTLYCANKGNALIIEFYRSKFIFIFENQGNLTEKTPIIFLTNNNRNNDWPKYNILDVLSTLLMVNLFLFS